MNHRNQIPKEYSLMSTSGCVKNGGRDTGGPNERKKELGSTLGENAAT